MKSNKYFYINIILYCDLIFEILPSTIFSKFGFTNISLLQSFAESGNDYFQATIAVGKKIMKIPYFMEKRVSNIIAR